MRQRSQLIAWKVAGRVSDRHTSADEVVRETGWVFNNATGDHLTLADFVATGDDEVPAYLEAFGLRDPENHQQTMIEIGSGIGRMTAAFTREFDRVIAADLDIGFLERCYETVSRFGRATICVPLKLQTVGRLHSTTTALILHSAISRCSIVRKPMR